MNKNIIFILTLLLTFLGMNAFAIDLIQIPVKGKVTLVDITSKECSTCEKMLPVIENVKKIYSGKIEVVLVDFWKYPAIVKKIGTNTSPTILIFDESGDEVFRKYGYISEEELMIHLKMVRID